MIPHPSDGSKASQHDYTAGRERLVECKEYIQPITAVVFLLCHFVVLSVFTMISVHLRVELYHVAA